MKRHLFVIISLFLSSTSIYAQKTLCVFDYDLTISSHNCPAATEHCRNNTGGETYGWNDQCLGLAAKAAIAKCVENGAYISINSHAGIGNAIDKIQPIVDQNQFPEWLDSPGYDNPSHIPYYPKLINDNINQDPGMYFMWPGSDKMELIKRSMSLIGMDPNSKADKERVIFWDDSGSNISAANAWGDIRAIKVDRLGDQGGGDGGCGIEQKDIDAGWAGLEVIIPGSSVAEESSSSVLSSSSVVESSTVSSAESSVESSASSQEESSELSSEESSSEEVSSEESSSSEEEISSDTTPLFTTLEGVTFNYNNELNSFNIYSETVSESYTLTVVNVLGNVFYQKELQGSASLNMASYESGLYFVRYQSEKGNNLVNVTVK